MPVGPNIKELINTRLVQEVEGTCSGLVGYIIAVVQILDVGRGVLVNGFAEYNVQYKAIVFKPFKNQVVDGLVTIVNKIGFWCEVGPLQVFISQHLIPDNLVFDPTANPPAYVSEEEYGDGQRVEKGQNVRIRIVGTRVDATEIFAIGTLKEDFLGPGATNN